jgi:steroid 5-alpha reductase family enzyme
MLLFLTALWAFRLSGYILNRFIKKKVEDTRYTSLRQKWGELHILGLFLFQGGLILILSTPFLSIAFDQKPLNLLDFFGFILSLIAILGETVADWQLKEFSKNNKGAVCNVGLWSRSRHPNYFFEWLFWIGIALIALQAPFGVTGIIACALMLCIFLFFSIPLTEKELLKSRQELYSNYQKTVPGFFPCLRS